jgi:small multidrug resistance pump
MKNWLFLTVAIVAEVFGTTALKASYSFTKFVPSVMVVIGYGLAFYFLSLTLKSIPIGVAYAIWSGLGVVLITLVAWIVYGQKLDLAALIGMVLIVSGVIVMNLFSETVSH